MTLLTEGELEAMRATASEALDGSAVVRTQTFVSDGGGGGTTVWTAAGTFACRIAPLSGSDELAGERVTSGSEVLITLPAETAVDHNAQIVSGGGTFAVIAVRERSEELTRRVEAKVLK